LANLIYVEMIIFIALLLVGYVYVLRKGAFDWNERARLEAEAEARLLADVERRHIQRRKTAA
jgi:hypothetical protein